MTMFNDQMKQTLVSLFGAVLLSTLCVGTAVGPARAVETRAHVAHHADFVAPLAARS